MWIVKIALDRPYTFMVLALVILILSPVVILSTPTDIFPSINIPVIAVAWTYSGLSPEETEGRITTVYERTLTTLVDNIQHIESTTVNGTAIVKVYLQPSASIDRANAQVTAVSQTILRQLPPGSLPPLIINYNASTVPILQLGLSGKDLTEPQLNDIALNFLRTQLVTVPGAAVPYPFGGRVRQIMINLNQGLLQAKNVSPNDVLSALGSQYLILPGGTAKIGEFEYDVDLNTDPKTVEELNDLPVKTVGDAVIYFRDVATVSDGFGPQTNIVRQDGNRGVLVTVLKAGDASTIDVVKGIRQLLPHVAQTLPPELKIQPLLDQSIFVQGSINGVVREAVIAAALTGLMILIFLGSWRSTVIIAISIPLAILTSVIVLSFLHETINIMTLGGLALAVGILVDDATVTIENIERHLDEGAGLHDGILDGAAQIAVPALVSTLCICIVFLPMFFLSGVARYLFVPLAEAVIFAMIASYVLSRTLVPTLAMYLLKAKQQGGYEPPGLFARFHQGFEGLFETIRTAYSSLLTRLVSARIAFAPAFLITCLCAFILIPSLGQDFFPTTDSGQFILHVRAKTGTRIEETARSTDLVEASIRHSIPVSEIDSILDNIGLPSSNINYMYNNSGLTGAADVDVLVSLKEKHHPIADYVRTLRGDLPRQFPGTTFYFLPADIVTQILNFGLPAPIDVQIDGPDIAANQRVADKMLTELRHVHGIADLRIQQQSDYPKFHIEADRTKAAQGGFTEHDIANSVLISLSGSFQVTPTFYLNPKNGVSYNLVTQTPQYSIQSQQDIQNIPISGPNQKRPAILADVASIHRTSELASINHYNIRRVVDIYASVQDRDLGAVGRDVNRIVEANKTLLPRGSFVTTRGQYGTMRSSYIGLIVGLGFAIIMVYLLIVVNFQSWLDPFVIITALPAALAGIVLFLFTTHTTLSVPALMGAIMCMGVATANSILVVSFARERLLHHGDSLTAAIEAGTTRFRPVIMTALAMIIGMIPMALGLGDGGEQNAPLGRAVIGGLLCATVATLVFVPSVFALLHGRTAGPDARPGHELGWRSYSRIIAADGNRRTMSTRENNASEVTQAGNDRSACVPARSRFRWSLLGLAVASLVLGFAIYSGLRERAQAETTLGVATERAAVPTVTVINPSAREEAEEIALPGATQAFIDTPIFARTNGHLRRWYFDIGAHVVQGQLLAVIEAPEVDQQLDQAKANLKTAQASEKLAEITAARWQNLLKTDSVSKQETDQAIQDLSARQATVDSMKADVQRLEQLQSYERIYAPFSGVITARNTDIGALINEGAGGAQGLAAVPQELFHMAAVNMLRVYVAVPEVDSRAAQTGAKATLTLDEFPGEKFQGTIVRDSDSIDPSSRTLRVEVNIDNAQGRIKTGAYVFVHLKVPQSRQSPKHSVMVPSNTLLFRAEGLRVGVVRNGRAELVPITISRDFGATVEVVAGLRPTDQVIVNPSDSLTSGSPVQVSARQTGDSR